LAERLLGGSDAVSLPSPEAPYGRQFEGFTGQVVEPVPAGTPVVPPAASEPVAPPAQPPERPVPAPDPEAAPLPPVVAGSVGSAPAEAPRGPFLQRVQRFRGWLREQFGVRGMFLLDREGTAIFNDGLPENLEALARSLAQASRAGEGAGSNVHVKVGADATLEVIPVDTHYGVIVLGAVVPQAVSPRGVGLIIDGLRRTAMPPG